MREGDEGEPDDAQGLTESGNARGREEEEDRGKEEDDGHRSTVRSLARLAAEANEGGEGSRGTATMMLSCLTL